MHTVMHRESSGLVRGRLLGQLNAVRTAPLALVTAPAGFGKTTLLTHYAHYFRANTGGPVGWLGLGPGHADAARLVADIRRALPCELPPPRDESDVDELVRAVEATGDEQLLLVLDDVHCLDNSPAEQVLDRLIATLPPRLRLILAARRMPRLNFARHELADVVILDAEQLRFRSWETEQLLRIVYRAPLPPADIAALDRRIGGWVAGLQLFHLSTRGRTLAERREAVAALDGRATLVRAYLARTVLAELPVKLRDFLVRTSVFDVLTAARCDKLLRRHDSARHLAELERLQAFTTSPDGGRTYRYHEALRSHLAASLSDGIGEKAARRHHSRAAQLLVEEGALTEAARAYARAEDWTTVRRLLSRIGSGIVDDGVEPWRDVLPAWLVAEDPWLRLAEGKHLFSRGQLSAAADTLIRGAALFGDDDGRAHSRAALSRVSVWMPGPAAPQGGHWVNRLRAATQRHPAMAAAQAERVPAPYGPLVRVLAHCLTGRFGEAALVLAAIEPDGGDLTGLALRICQAIELITSDTEAGTARLAELAADAERAQYPWLARMARAAVAFDGTEQSAKIAVGVGEECARDGDDWGAAVATGIGWLMRAGSPDADASALAELVDRCGRLDAGVLQSWAQALYALAAVATHLPDADVEAHRAIATARAAGSPGAQVAALIAAARCDPLAVEYVDRARLLAVECGLPQVLVDRWLAAPPDAEPTPSHVHRAPLAILCLGGFQAFRDGVPLDFTAVKPRARALLRLLAIHAGSPVHRDVLVDALWPTLPPAAATHSLHVAVSSLRRLLEPGVDRGAHRIVVREGDSYRLMLPADGYCDVVEFRRAVTESRRTRTPGGLRAVLLAYTGELLPGDGAAEWVVREREDLRRAAADTAAGLASMELAAGDAAAAAVAAERCVSVDRYHDEGWRLLIESCERGGNRAAASDARGRYGQILAELDVE
ncbi:hypothetical protein Afil01_51380 [Actinorhabdospora filicis]|uniref:OmpR/PhoB-type domain-containing protein n=1 Tax=Actinorhabdospora filicis TaxID=1785913 RepID=A0A9W6WC82_9ACTN|nr:winged helix-turn-helix domain-containing protein [Actinorhabdospora filicis]GLZ80331.1 hypothetical protein Afil01_51380 [Actinorhabdospora filicis]